MPIRRKVFIEGQNVPESEEVDGLDESSDHYLLKYENTPVGTARIRYVDGKAKVERVSILSEYQGQGFGKKIMLYLIAEITRLGKVKTIILGSQSHAISFYQKLGFEVCSDEYLDAGILHKDMQLPL